MNTSRRTRPPHSHQTGSDEQGSFGFPGGDPPPAGKQVSEANTLLVFMVTDIQNRDTLSKSEMEEVNVTVNTGDVVRVTTVLTDENEGLIENVFWAKQVSGNVDDGNWMSFTLAHLETMFGYIDNYMTDGVAFTEVRGYNVTQDYALPTVSWNTLDTGEVDVANPMPAPCSALILARTPFSKAVSRKYLSGFTEADHSDGTWQSALLAALGNFALSWAQAYQTGTTETAQFGCLSKASGVWRPLIGLVVKEVVAYQRRRRAGRGV
jgi:hypothetical protein